MSGTGAADDTESLSSTASSSSSDPTQGDFDLDDDDDGPESLGEDKSSIDVDGVDLQGTLDDPKVTIYIQQ